MIPHLNYGYHDRISSISNWFSNHMNVQPRNDIAVDDQVANQGLNTKAIPKTTEVLANTKLSNSCRWVSACSLHHLPTQNCNKQLQRKNIWQWFLETFHASFVAYEKKTHTNIISPQNSSHKFCRFLFWTIPFAKPGWLHNTLGRPQEALPLQNYRGVCFRWAPGFSHETPSNKGISEATRNRREIHVDWEGGCFPIIRVFAVFTLHLFNWLKGNTWTGWRSGYGKHLPQTLRAAFFPLARKTYQNCVNAGWEVKFETSKWVKDKEGYKIPHVIHSLFLGTFKGVLA